jgi:hypothetical protein
VPGVEQAAGKLTYQALPLYFVATMLSGPTESAFDKLWRQPLVIIGDLKHADAPTSNQPMRFFRFLPSCQTDAHKVPASDRHVAKASG